MSIAGVAGNPYTLSKTLSSSLSDESGSLNISYQSDAIGTNDPFKHVRQREIRDMDIRMTRSEARMSHNTSVMSGDCGSEVARRDEYAFRRARGPASVA